MEVDVKNSSEQAVLLGRIRPSAAEKRGERTQTQPQATRPANSDTQNIAPQVREDAARVDLSGRASTARLDSRVEKVTRELVDNAERLARPGTVIRDFHESSERVRALVAQVFDQIDVAQSATGEQDPFRVLKLIGSNQAL